MSNELLRYFIQVSLDYKKEDLFNRIINILDLPIFEKLKWRLFYTYLPLRMVFYKIYKKTTRNKDYYC